MVSLRLIASLLLALLGIASGAAQTVVTYASPFTAYQNVPFGSGAPLVDGDASIEFVLVQPNLPSGLSLTPQGKIAGTPTQASSLQTYTLS